VDTNIAGGKTDGVVAEDVHLETSFESDGSLVDTVTISRTDNGTPGDQFTGLKNIDYVRVYAPPGSELLSAEGFERPADGYFQKPDSSLQASALLTATEGNVSIGTGDTDITEESGLAVFGNWMQIEPGGDASRQDILPPAVPSHRLPDGALNRLGEVPGRPRRLHPARPSSSDRPKAGRDPEPNFQCYNSSASGLDRPEPTARDPRRERRRRQLGRNVRP